MESGGMIVVVTGASGFIGRQVCEELESRGTDVRRLSRSPGDRKNSFAADVTNPDRLINPFRGADRLIHCAGLAHSDRADPRQLMLVNAEGTSNVFSAAAAAGVRRAVLVSSVSVYGDQGSADEQTPCRPATAYGISKLAAEREAQRVSQESGMDLITLRLATVYGAGDPGNVRRLIMAIDGHRFARIGDGRNRKSLIHVRDAARACATAALSGVCGTFNVSGEPATMREIVQSISNALGRELPPVRLPEGLLRLSATLIGAVPIPALRAFGHTLRRLIADDVYDATAFNRQFRFSPGVPLHEGLREEVDWVRRSRP